MDLLSFALFPSPSPSYTAKDYPGEIVWLPPSLDAKDADSAEAVPCLFLTSPSARFVLLYLHSNAEDIGRCFAFCNCIRHTLQVHVLAVEYPGYGICPAPKGWANHETVTGNARLAFRFITDVLKWPSDGILVFGRSIGTGPALILASENIFHGLILVSPFCTTQELVRNHIGPLASFTEERFPNIDVMAKVRSPLLIVHGKVDTVVPVDHSERLYEACRARKRFVCPELMGHNGSLLQDVSFFILPMMHFYGLPDYSFDDLQVPEEFYRGAPLAKERTRPDLGEMSLEFRQALEGRRKPQMIPREYVPQEMELTNENDDVPDEDEPGVVTFLPSEFPGPGTSTII